MFNKLVDVAKNGFKKEETKQSTELGSAGPLGGPMTERNLIDELRLVEAGEELFGHAEPEELKQRKIDRKNNELQEVINNILADSTKNPDGSIDVKKREISDRFPYGFKLKSFSQLKLNINVWEGSLSLGNLEVKDLKGLPRIVTGQLDISSMPITNLIGIPQILRQPGSDSYNRSALVCYDLPNLKELVSSKLPQTFDGDLTIRNCGLTTLKGLPTTIKGSLDISRNENLPVDALKDLPRVVAGDLHIGEHSEGWDLTPLFNIKIGGILYIPDEEFDLRNIDWKRLNVRQGIRLQETISPSLNEALKSSVIRFLQPFFAVKHKTYRGRWDRVGTEQSMISGLQWDKITDDDIDVVNDPKSLLPGIKSGEYDNAHIFWILMTTKGKFPTVSYNSGRGRYKSYTASTPAAKQAYQKSDGNKTVLPALLAISQGTKITQYNKLFKPYENFTQLSNVADMAIVIKKSFSSKGLVQQRIARREGAIALMDDEDILKANRSRYNMLLQNKRANTDIKDLVKKYMTELTSLALDVKMGGNKMKDYIGIDLNKDGSVSTHPIRRPGEAVERLLNDLWRNIDSFNRYSEDLASEEEYLKKNPPEPGETPRESYYAREMKGIKNKIIADYNAFRAKRLSNVW